MLRRRQDGDRPAHRGDDQGAVGGTEDLQVVTSLGNVVEPREDREAGERRDVAGARSSKLPGKESSTGSLPVVQFPATESY